MASKKLAAAKAVKSLTHEEARRRNIPTAEYESVVDPTDKSPIRTAYGRRNRDLDPQLVWRGKDEQDVSDLVVPAPLLYIQEKVHPKALLDDLLSDTRRRAHEAGEIMPDLFADFNGLPKGVDKTEFYRHDQNWSNRLILGDSLQVMACLAEREGLRGKVQCIYIDPPYGIKFNSNFQWSTTTRDVKDGDITHITREPEQVKAFRDTWRDGIHSYLTYLRDRLSVARELLADSGSIFVQIGDENVHRVRALMDEVFGDDNFVLCICFKKKGNQKGSGIESVSDNILWYAKDIKAFKPRNLFRRSEDTPALERDFRSVSFDGKEYAYNDFLVTMNLPAGTKVAELKGIIPNAEVFMSDNLTVGGFRTNQSQLYKFRGRDRDPGLKRNRCWMHTSQPVRGEKYCGLDRLAFADRLIDTDGGVRKKVYLSDSGVTRLSNMWDDTGGASDPRYVVETSTEVIKRCILMATDPGQLVLDPTCGSGATAYVAEQWGRRWITIDTSRVALALARARIMGARYPYYLLADSREAQLKDAEINAAPVSSHKAHNDIRHGFFYERVPHITSTTIANNVEIDVIWDRWQTVLEPLGAALNAALLKTWQEWQIPLEVDPAWPDPAKVVYAKWWEARLECQREINTSIAAKAEFEYLYDKPYQDKKTVRVAGPFTVESLSPHRELGIDEHDRTIDPLELAHAEKTFAELILDNLKTAGVQQAHKEDKVAFTSLVPWPGDYVCAEGRYLEGSNGSGKENRAGIFIGPEFGTITRQDLVLAAREASEGGFDVLISCGFNYEAHTTEFNKLGRLPVLKARMNADLHMSSDLAKTAKANLFVVFGEPDIVLLPEPGDSLRVKINGVDVYHPSTGEVTSSGPDQIACWFIDTDYNEESFFVRHAYFLGANDPYDALKRTLKSEIDADAWSSLNSDTSRKFARPKSGRIAVKVINHLGDEVMKVFKVA